MRIEYTNELGIDIIVTTDTDTDANADACDRFEAKEHNRKYLLKLVKNNIKKFYAKMSKIKRN